MTIEEALEKYNDPVNNYLIPYMEKIVAECPELTDGWKLLCAAEEMALADDEDRELSPRESLDIVKDEVQPTEEQLAERARQSEEEIAKMFPPKPGFERPPTMREFFESLFSPGEIPEEITAPHDELHVKVAQTILRRQAGELVREACFDSLYAPENDEDPWAITVSFRPGELSKNGQLVLQKMKHNSHASRLKTEKDMFSVSFIVYRI